MPLSKEKKEAYFKRMEGLLSTYTKVFIVKVDNVGSQQLQSTRMKMRGIAEILMGKNTLMRKIFASFLETNPDHPIGILMELCRGNIGFVFTNSELTKVRDLILANRVPAPAKIGAVAPEDVTVPPGPTGCDPGQTSFFQVLQIPTKIVKGQIEITNEVFLIKAGDKVKAAEAGLLKKLNIKPFSYGMVIDKIYDNGAVFGIAVLSIDDNLMKQKFKAALGFVAAISLATGYVNQTTMVHSIGGAFRNCVAVSLQCETYSFKQAAAYK